MVDQPVRVVAAACDGACSGNPGPGGWGALLRFEDGAVRVRPVAPLDLAYLQAIEAGLQEWASEEDDAAFAEL